VDSNWISKAVLTSIWEVQRDAWSSNAGLIHTHVVGSTIQQVRCCVRAPHV
jgi:hypothetical protein